MSNWIRPVNRWNTFTTNQNQENAKTNKSKPLNTVIHNLRWFNWRTETSHIESFHHDFDDHNQILIFLSNLLSRISCNWGPKLGIYWMYDRKVIWFLGQFCSFSLINRHLFTVSFPQSVSSFDWKFPWNTYPSQRKGHVSYHLFPRMWSYWATVDLKRRSWLCIRSWGQPKLLVFLIVNYEETCEEQETHVRQIFSNRPGGVGWIGMVCWHTHPPPRTVCPIRGSGPKTRSLMAWDQ